jgi:diadenylate cyclase
MAQEKGLTVPDIIRQFRLLSTGDIALIILDIAIVAVILYRLLLIIKGTRAAQMLVGILVLLIASVISGYLRLYTLEWLLQSFWAYIVIAVIILFQPEIRRALAHVGEAPFLQAFTSAEELKSLEEVVKASVSLSNRKIGALIVIERETDLKDFIDIGTSLDARVSRELLLSLFHPTSPIHDGAAVIKGNRVIAAGCFLPIALKADINKNLGTRHRAALSITEETDAVAIIVSEETGGISFAMNGKLQERIDMGALRDILTELFTTKGQKR